MTEYLPAVEHLYQLADVYTFPVEATDNAIEAPLSVLEALACDLPVVTTRFGGLERLFGSEGRPGLTFVDGLDELAPATLRMLRGERHSTRALALPFSWDAVADQLVHRASDVARIHQRSALRSDQSRIKQQPSGPS